VKPSPPRAKVIPHISTVHGDPRVDDYFWMRDKADADVIAYLRAENAYTESVMKPTEDLQQTLYREIVGRIKETDLTVPVRRDDYFYYTRTEQGKQYSIYCRQRGSLEAGEQVLLDGNLLAEGHGYSRVGVFSVSPNHELLAYSLDVVGDEDYKIQVKDLTSGELLSDEIPNTYYTLEWANDNRTFFYTTLDESRRPYKVFRHTLGVHKDELVYHENDPRFSLHLSKAKSDAYVFIAIDSAVTSEIRYLPAGEPEAEFRVLILREHEVEYSVAHHEQWFYVVTNDGAKTFRMMRTPVANPGKHDWEEVIAARPEVTLEGAEAFRDHLIVYEREGGLPKIRVHDFRTGVLHYIDFPEPVYTASGAANPEYNSKLFRFNYTSLVTPASVFDYDMETRERELKKQYEVLGGYDPARYESERIHATAPDGVHVPVSLVYRKGLARDGSAPALMYGYGAYGHSSDPAFNSDRLSLLDRGFVFAIAHVRGGADLGRPWHDNGKLLKKKNTFYDFIACAESLIGGRYTSPDRFAIIGGSAGGLLMGAVANLRPELFGVIVAKVPFVDTLNTMLDPTLPLTISEYEEWGNPEQKEFYNYIRSYSPYDNIEPKAFPKILATGGLNDPRVSYWEPAKWVAKLRVLKTNDSLLLLKINLDSGHFGASGRYERMKETAFDYAFILHALGVLPLATAPVTVAALREDE
jgi:oligopeptidase B